MTPAKPAEKTRSVAETSSFRYSARLAGIIALCVFIAEIVLMAFFCLESRQISAQFMVLDGALLTLILSPALYFFLFRPMMIHMEERLRAEKALERLSSVAQQTADCVMMTLVDGTIQYVNPAFERLTGYSLEEAVGKNPKILKSGRHDSAYYKSLWGTILSGKPFRSVTLNRKKNGELFYWEQTITPMRDVLGNLSHFVSIAKDVTQQMEANRQKAEFVQILSHELRSPLGVIREGIAQIQEGLLGPVTASQKETTAVAMKTVNRLNRLINDLLDLSKMQSGRVPMRRELIDLAVLAREAVTSFREEAESKGVTLTCQATPETILLFADQDKLTQLFTNLLSNALKFTERGKVNVSVLEDGSQVECRVADTGCGIPEEYLSRVFGTFEQLPRPATAGKGTGLGLAICKAIAEMHMGTISVQSRVQEGTAFVLTLPKLDAEEALRISLEENLRACLSQGASLSVIILSFPLNGLAPADPASLRSFLRPTDLILPVKNCLIAILPAMDKGCAVAVETRLVTELRKHQESVHSEVVVFPEDSSDEEGFIQKVGSFICL